MPANTPSIDRLIAGIHAVVGDPGLLTDLSDTAPYAEDWRRLYQGRTPAVVRPSRTEDVARVVRLCAEAGVPIVPQGGNTSMVGGRDPGRGRQPDRAQPRAHEPRTRDRRR